MALRIQSHRPQVSTAFPDVAYVEGQTLVQQGSLVVPPNSGFSGFLFALTFSNNPILAGETIRFEFPDNGLHVGPVSAGVPEPAAVTLASVGLIALLLFSRRPWQSAVMQLSHHLPKDQNRSSR